MSSRRGLCQRRGAVYNSDMSLLQAEVERRGTQIFDLVDRHPESIFSKAGFYQRMMEFSMRDEHFKVQMFRFVDVLLRCAAALISCNTSTNISPTCVTAMRRLSAPASPWRASFQ